MTLIAVSTMVNSLVASWQQPQIQSRLELYQTNLLLQAAQGQLITDGTNTDKEDNKNWQQIRRAVLGEEPIKIAQEQYQNARQANQQMLEALTKKLSPTSETRASSTTKIIAQLQEVIPQLDLALGILSVELGNRQRGREIWQGLLNSQTKPSNLPKIPRATQETAKVLLNLWSDPPQQTSQSSSIDAIDATKESLIKANLTSWFRDRALNQLYTRQKSSAKLQALQLHQNSQAKKAMGQLLVLTLIPTTSGLLGMGLLLFLGGQMLLKGRQSILLSPRNSSGIANSGDNLPGDPSSEDSLSADNRAGVESKNKSAGSLVIPWDGETIWEVLVGGFFFVGQLLIPYLFSNLPLGSLNLEVRGKAIAVLASYVLMSVGTLSVLYFALRRFKPLPPGWFPVKWRGNWFLWGFGGYLAAIPLVIGVSLINQAIWQGKGGSNPILPLALQGNDIWSFLIFSTTASIAAPIFEEIIFRGFLLPSLTRYLPAWGAIAASSLLFAIAHLSLSEVLPLTVLGMVLGVVYWRSQNLLASMLLHGLWNSGTLISLYILSSGST